MIPSTTYIPKVGDHVLYKLKESKAFTKGFIVDALLNGSMVSFGSSEYSEAAYYHDANNFDIKKIGGRK